MDTKQTFKPGDRIAFDVDGSSRSPFGYGTITRVERDGTFLVTPQAAMPGHMRMVNIRKVEVTK